jgi:hypothetical protein
MRLTPTQFSVLDLDPLEWHGQQPLPLRVRGTFHLWLLHNLELQ